MLHIILQVLAIIGIILLVLLGLILFLIALLLFVPIRYRIKGNKDATGMFLNVRISYLLHLLTVRYSYPEPNRVQVRVFGIRVADIPIAGDDKEEEPVLTPDEVKMPADDCAISDKAESADANTASEEIKPAKETVSSEGASAEESPMSEEPEFASKSEEKEDAEKAKKRRGFHPIRWIREKIQKCIYTIRSICDKIKHILEQISYYKEVFTKEENKLLFGRVKGRLFKMLKSIRPRVLKAWLHVGTGSPDTTGYLCGIYGMLAPLLGNNVNIEPDFEEAVLEGNLYAKGRITLFVILLHSGNIYFDKQIRVFLKELKREAV